MVMHSIDHIENFVDIYTTICSFMLTLYPGEIIRRSERSFGAGEKRQRKAKKCIIHLIGGRAFNPFLYYSDNAPWFSSNAAKLCALI